MSGNQIPSNQPIWLAIIILTAVLAAAGCVGWAVGRDRLPGHLVT
jgi:hypothetical protein